MSRFVLTLIGVLCSGSLVVLSMSRFGLPLDSFTWLVVAVVASSGVSLGLPGSRRPWFLVSLAAGLYLVFPGPCQVVPLVEKWSLFDDRGGRSGWGITPCLRFGREGPNTELMESLVGRLEPNWWYQAPQSPYIRDGNERVHSRSIIRKEFFPELMEMLPNDNARCAVVLALTDTQNRLRVHQGLLLTCLFVEGSPAGWDANAWWLHNEALLQSEHDPAIAASIAIDWIAKIESCDALANNRLVATQLRAAKYQQRGGWGGHYDFGEAFQELAHQRAEPDAKAYALGRSFLWWSEPKAADLQ